MDGFVRGFVLLLDTRHGRSSIETVIVQLVVVLILLLVVRCCLVLRTLAFVILISRVRGFIVGMVTVDERVAVFRLVVAAFYSLHPRLVLLHERQQLVGTVVADIRPVAYRCAPRHIRLTGVFPVIFAIQHRLYVLQAVR